MPTETEIKIRLTSAEQFAAVLSRCGKLYGPGNEIIQRDEYFDTSNEILKEKDFTVRLRIVNGKGKIALKGPRGYFANNIHERIELEFSVASEEEVRAEIAQQNLTATAILEKRRWEFARDDIHIAVDTLPFIGSFLEIEGLTPERINRVLTVLNLIPSNAVRENYTELMEQRLTELGLPLRPDLRATFEAEHTFGRTRSEEGA